jgi:hypothetical protein
VHDQRDLQRALQWFRMKRVNAIDGAVSVHCS